MVRDPAALDTGAGRPVLARGIDARRLAVAVGIDAGRPALAPAKVRVVRAVDAETARGVPPETAAATAAATAATAITSMSRLTRIPKDWHEARRAGSILARMNPVLIISHLEDRHSGLAGESLKAAGCPVSEWNPLDDAPAPSLDRIAGIVSLGGRESATDLDRHPFLAAEVELMRIALANEVPILGMCLGAQLLAVAAGGRVTRLESMYVGWPELCLLPAAGDDPVLGSLGERLPVLKWHEDVIELPPEGVVLGVTETPGAALFRIGHAAWGSQAHLELTPPMLLDGWLTESGGIAEIESAGNDIEAFRAESARRLPIQMAIARPAFEAFARLVLPKNSISAALNSSG